MYRFLIRVGNHLVFELAQTGGRIAANFKYVLYSIVFLLRRLYMDAAIHPVKICSKLTEILRGHVTQSTGFGYRFQVDISFCIRHRNRLL